MVLANPTHIVHNTPQQSERPPETTQTEATAMRDVRKHQRVKHPPAYFS